MSTDMKADVIQTGSYGVPFQTASLQQHHTAQGKYQFLFHQASHESEMIREGKSFRSAWDGGMKLESSYLILSDKYCLQVVLVEDPDISISYLQKISPKDFYAKVISHGYQCETDHEASK